MIKVTKELIKELADDIMIDLTEEEIDKVLSTEQNMMQEFLKVTTMNVEGVSPMHYPFDITNTYLREDEDSFKITKEDLMRNASSKNEDYVLIKKVVK